MSFESRDIDELGNHVVEDTSSDHNLSSIATDLSDAEIPSILANATEQLEIGEIEEYQTESSPEIVCAGLCRSDSLTDAADAASPSTLVSESERLETSRTEEHVTKFVAEVTKTIVDLCNEDSRSPSDTVTKPERLQSDEEVVEAKGLTYAEVVSADPVLPDSTVDTLDAERLRTEGRDEAEGRTYAEVVSAQCSVPDCSININNGERLDDEEGEEKKRRTYAEVAKANPIPHDPFPDSAGTVSLSDVAASTESSENRCTEEVYREGVLVKDLKLVAEVEDVAQEVIREEGELGENIHDKELEGVRKEVNEEDNAEELVLGSGATDAFKRSSSPHEEDIQNAMERVQGTSTNDSESNKPRAKSISDNIAENEAGKEPHLVKTSISPTLQGEVEYLPNSKQLPAETGKNVLQLKVESSGNDGVCLVYIIGTAHVSKASCEEVQALIRYVKPDVVFLELCSSRTNILLPRKNKVPTLSGMLESYKKKEMNVFGLLYSWFLAKVGEKLEVLPGTEFRVAYEEALNCGASVTLGDRPVQITLKRTWGSMSLWLKTKFLFSVLTATFNMPSAEEFHALLEKMDQSDELTLMVQELSKTFPTLLETLVNERDLYMVANLRNVARRFSSVVAVVGRGHLSGMSKRWEDDINVEELLTLPSKKTARRLWLWSTVALGVGGVVVGIHMMRRR